ncbi:hypothetical protein ACHAQJ_010510 [Trichoderma viride]
MAATNSFASSPSIPPFSATGVRNGGQTFYGYDQVSAGYSAASVSAPNAHIRAGSLCEPIDPNLLGDSTSSGESPQYWSAQEVPYFQPASSDSYLDPNLAHDAPSGCIYQADYRQSGSPFSFQNSPVFSLKSPSIGSDGNYDMVSDPATPPDAQGPVISLGSPYDSDYAFESNIKQPEVSFYSRPQDEEVANPAYYNMGGLGLNGQCIFDATPSCVPLENIGAADAGAPRYPSYTTLPYANSPRLIKEESLPPNMKEMVPAARAIRRRSRNSRYHYDPMSSDKRVYPGGEGSPYGDRKRKAQTTNKRFCHKCKKNFQSRASLDEHTGMVHPRPYTCVFHYAGCTARFDAKNEWKRHVSTKHLGLKYWVCTEGKCADERQSSYQQRAGLPPNGNIFNRKDLYTQHIRRMHSNIAGQSTTDYKGAGARSDFMVKKMQEEALRIRCRLPTWMPCPVQSCGKSFTGSNAWDERMEHVAQQHFDNAAAGREPPVEFGGPHDEVLTEWAQRSDISIVKRTEMGWELCDPLKGDSEYRMTTADGEE